MKKYSLGIDIGGTFTDIVLLDMETGRYATHKELTTPNEPEIGVIRGIHWVLNTHAIEPSSISRIVHATTLFTNALIERRGANTGLITTAGFKDVLEIGRERRYDLYDNFLELLQPLVPSSLRLEVEERMDPNGEIIHPLDEQALLTAAQTLDDMGVESIAVAFLHAYKNPKHEHLALKIIAKHFPHIAVSGSAEVVAEIREYERFSTAVANAYVKPLAERYISLLESRLREDGITASLFLMQSNGGLVHAEEAKRLPIQLLESGPAAGALVAAYFGEQISEPKVLAFDMGGTTAKLSVIDDNQPSIAYTFEAARQKRFKPGSGMPIKISTIELIEIGAGGGSIAHIDELGLLRVGPLSAGSDPGPACYLKGGTQATVTDANLCLGYLNPATFARGSITISPEAAEQAVEHLAQKLDMPLDTCSRGISEVVNENMAAAARVHIAEQGGDVRHYSLLVTGGGGPLHGYSVARKLGLQRIICPPSAGVASALGLLIAPPKVTKVMTIAEKLSTLSMSMLESQYQQLEQSAIETLRGTGADIKELTIQRYADLRFVGQGFELVTELPHGPCDDSWYQQIKACFAQRYQQVFTVMPPVNDLDIVNIRIAVTGNAADFLDKEKNSEERSSEAETVSRQAYCPDLDQQVSMPVLHKHHLNPHQPARGPAIVEDDVSTLIIGSHSQFYTLDNGVLVIDLN